MFQCDLDTFCSEVERDLQKSRKLKMKGDSNHGDHERGRGSVTHVESVVSSISQLAHLQMGYQLSNWLYVQFDKYAL